MTTTRRSRRIASRCATSPTIRASCRTWPSPFSRTGRLEEAIRCYRRALELEPQLTGAHYGLAFLLIKRGELSSAETHLTAFLGNPPKGGDTDRWVRHAQQTLEQLHASNKSGPATGPE